MSADSLSWPHCKTKNTEHYVSKIIHGTHRPQWWDHRVDPGIRRKETKSLGVPPTLINIKSLRRLLDLDQTCLLLCGLSAVSSHAQGTYFKCISPSITFTPNLFWSNILPMSLLLWIKKKYSGVTFGHLVCIGITFCF